MIRNEYRRAFIMLRAAVQGYGGHARLERRTLSGSLYFVVTAPQGAEGLAAALAGQRDGEYFAAPIGPLTRDRRGQLTLAWQFDPRDIAGRPLEAYSWAVVTEGGRTPVLTGNLEGSRPLDLAALRRAVTGGASARSDVPAADLPAPDERLTARANGAAAGAEPAPAEPAREDFFIEPQEENGGASSSRNGSESDLEREARGRETGGVATGSDLALREASRDGEVMRDDVRVYTRSRARARRRAVLCEAGEAQPGATSRPEVSAPEAAAGEPAPDAPEVSSGDSGTSCEIGSSGPGSEAVSEARPSDGDPGAPSGTERFGVDSPRGGAVAGSDAPGTGVSRGASLRNEAQTAARQLGLDITRPWPRAAEPLRRLFATQAPAQDAPEDGDREDGFVYISAPMPEGSGYGNCLVGLRAEDGRPAAVRYALPARYAPEPPAGLEGYAWADGDGGAGWWIKEENLQ